MDVATGYVIFVDLEQVHIGKELFHREKKNMCSYYSETCDLPKSVKKVLCCSRKEIKINK